MGPRGPAGPQGSVGETGPVGPQGPAGVVTPGAAVADLSADSDLADVIGTVNALFLYPKNELDRLEALKKQISRIQKAEALPVVFILPSVDC